MRTRSWRPVNWSPPFRRLDRHDFDGRSAHRSVGCPRDGRDDESARSQHNSRDRAPLAWRPPGTYRWVSEPGRRSPATIKSHSRILAGMTTYNGLKRGVLGRAEDPRQPVGSHLNFCCPIGVPCARRSDDTNGPSLGASRFWPRIWTCTWQVARGKSIDVFTLLLVN
jgi:hypothetical protein